MGRLYPTGFDATGQGSVEEAVDNQGNLLTQTGPLPAGTNKSGTITTGATAQVLSAALTTRKGLWLQNISAGDLWVNEFGTAVTTGAAGNTKIPTMTSWQARTNRAISIIGATTAQAFTAVEW